MTMKQFSLLFLLVPLFLAVACLDDATAPSNDPAIPQVRYDSETLTRVSMTLTGSYPDEALAMEHGIELAENSFASGPEQVFSDLSCTVDIRPGAVYVVRSYFSNGHYRKTSPVLTVTAPLTSAATLNEVTSENNRLVASIRDDGGRTVREVGFCWAEVSDPKAIRKHRIPAELGSDGSFFLDFSAFEPGKTYYILAYAENATASNEVFGYSRTPLEIKVSDEFPVTIEDPSFARYLVANFDSNHDGILSTKEIPAITAIDVNTDDIYSLRGIEMMPDLEWVACRGTSAGSGKLTTIDLSHNPKIKTLYCDNNQLGGLDVSSLPDLARLSCPGNGLTGIDLSANQDITWLDVSDNGLTSLDVSDLFRLVYLDCRNNQLTALDVSGNPYLATLLCDENRLTALDVSLNQDLTVLHCPTNQLGSLQLWNKKLDTLWCFNNQLTSLDISHAQNIREVRCDNVRIPDANFKKSLCVDFDNDGDGEISLAEASFIEEINVSTENIASLSGIEYFPNLWALYCNGSENGGGKLTSLDLSHNPKLRFVECFNNRLTSLNVSGLSSLLDLRCGKNQLTTLNLSSVPSLKFLECSHNRLTGLDLRRCPNLTGLECVDNQLTSLDVSSLTQLAYLNCYSNNLTQLDISKNQKLATLICTSNQMTWLDVTQNPGLTLLECDFVPISDAVFQAYLVQNFDKNGDQAISIAEAFTITDIDLITRYVKTLDGIAYFLNLTRLVCDGYGNPDYPEEGLYGLEWDPAWGDMYNDNRYYGFSSLDISHNTKLITLIIIENSLTTLDVSNNLALQYLDCSENYYLESLWLLNGQTIEELYYDDGTELYYK